MSDVRMGDILLAWTRNAAYPTHLALYVGSTFVHATPTGERAVEERPLGKILERIFAVFRFVRPKQPIEHAAPLHEGIGCEQCILDDPRSYQTTRMPECGVCKHV